MRSISSAIISFVLFYIALSFKKDFNVERGFLAFLSFIMLGIAIILMILGV